VRLSVGAYRAAARLLPADFRARFGTELVATFADMARDRHTRHGLAGLVRLWMQAARDVVRQAGGERWARRGAPDPARGLRAPGGRPPDRRVVEERGDAGMLETLRQDVKFAVRTLVKTPTFTAAVVITIALGVGATTAIFTVVNGILLRPLPFAGSERVVMLCETNPRTDWCGASPVNVADMARESRTLEAAGVGRQEPLIAQMGGETFSVRGAIATPGFFKALGVVPALGRLIEDRDMDRGANDVAVVSDRFWRNRLRSDPAAVGRAITIDGRSVTVIGVLRPDVFVPYFGSQDLWKPLTASIDGDSVEHRDWRGFYPFGRIKADESLMSANTELQTLHARLVEAYPEANKDWGLRLESLRAHLVGPVSRTLWTFLAAVGFVLLIASANVASLLLVRATGRAPEFAVRASLGAGRRRLVQQLLTESLIISFAGGAVGLLLAVWTTRAFVTLAPGSIPRLAEVSIDGRVALFAFLLSTATAVFFGFAPARRASRTDLSGTLKGIRHADAGDARLRSAFVVAELALALVLLVGAGLLTRSFSRLLNWDPGFERAGLVMTWMLPPGNRYTTREELMGVMERVRAEVATVPGVEHAALASGGPLIDEGGDGTYGLTIEGRPGVAPEDAPPAEFYNIDPYYFATLGVRIVRGRDLARTDTFGSVHVAVVNETLARRYFPDEDPIGQRVTVDKHTAEVVGIVNDIRPFRPDQPTKPIIYWPTEQFPRGAANIFMRTTPGLEGLEKTVRARVAAIDPQIQLSTFSPLDVTVDRHLVSPRFNMVLVGTFAVVAVLLAAVGVYGVIAFTVASRTREIGVRIALGATPGGIVSEVVSRGMTLAAIGMAFGLAGALVVGRFLESLLYGLPPTDLLTLGGAVVGFALVALVASWVPARRAAKVDPIAALRTE